MGLRINHNVASLQALRQLSVQDAAQSKSLQRLSTGLRINTAADDPSGLVISEQLRAQTASLRAAVRNSEFASNLIGTAEAALNEVSALLVGVRESVIFALNSGTLTAEQVAAEQASVDQALNAIDRVAASTRFGSKSLLDGSSAFQVVNRTTRLDSVFIREAQFNPNQTSLSFNYQITAIASRAMVRLAATGEASSTMLVNTVAGGSANSGEVIKFRITGALGVTEITTASGATFRDFMDQVNANTSTTGVYASSSSVTGGGGAESASMALYSTGFGSDQSITIERVTTSSEASNLALNSGFSLGGYDQTQNPKQFTNLVTMSDRGQLATDAGADIVVNVNATPVTGKGNKLNINLPTLKAELVFAPQTATMSAASATTLFAIKNNSSSGLTFQFSDKALPGDRISIGLDSVRTADLGITLTPETATTTAAANAGVLGGGALSSLRSGTSNDLTTNPQNALKIVDDAIAKVSSIRASLGSLKSNTIDPNISSLNVAIENLTATESSIRDLDFAEQTSEFVRSQIMFQAATSVLASANLIPQAVLSLLQ